MRDAENEAALPSIGDYAVIGDCRTAALVSREGSIDWLCLPNFSGPSVFARLLDPAGGTFALRPAGPFTATRRYLPGTAVLETTFRTSTGVARLLDCLPVGDDVHRLRPMREVLRVLTGVAGRITFELTLDPRPNYARPGLAPATASRFGWCCAWGDEVLHLRADVPVTPDGAGVTAQFDVAIGDRQRFALAYAKGEPLVFPELGAAADARLEETTGWWRRWSQAVCYDGPYREMVIRSAVTLKLLSYCLSGAIVAAPTTSLPEEIGGGRNWDYRYCWLRDAGLTMHALLGLGIDEDAKGFLEWLLHATRLTRPKLRIMYDLYGRTGLEERELGHLVGFRGSRPVRIGNGAYRQQQTDVYGEVLLAAHAYAAGGGRIDGTGARMLKGLGRVIRAIWRDPDSGIWEVRGALRHYTYSKMMCWVGLDRLLTLDDLGVLKLGRERAETERVRQEIAAMIELEAYNERLGAYAGELGGEVLDASILTMASVGYRPANDPRVISTHARIREVLGQGSHGLIRRYDPIWDGLEGGEGAFGICSFWAVEQAAREGDPDAAERRLERLLTLANDVGLFAEEADGKTGEPLGNFPQAFTHVGFINAVLAISRARGLPAALEGDSP
jgi:GH15 family glucan-1,4-alpha-glucosidase